MGSVLLFANGSHSGAALIELAVRQSDVACYEGRAVGDRLGHDLEEVRDVERPHGPLPEMIITYIVPP